MNRIVPVGDVFSITGLAVPQLGRTSTTPRGDSANTAFMNEKSTKFRDIMLNNKAEQFWDLSVGWLLCVGLQKIPLLRKTLFSIDANIFTYKNKEDGIQLFLKKKNMFVTILLGGAGYRGITSFVSNALQNDSLKAETSAPRSHDFDISFGVNNFKKNINDIQNTVCQFLIIFLNMLFNEFEEKMDNFWTKKHLDADGKEIFFIPLSEVESHSSREIKLWTHKSGLLQITMLKTKKYINIRTNIAIQYIDNSGNPKKELDHIVELVFWDMAGTEGTVTLLQKIKTDNSMFNILGYVNDFSIDTENYENKTAPKFETLFTGNDKEYYDDVDNDDGYGYDYDWEAYQKRYPSDNDSRESAHRDSDEEQKDYNIRYSPYNKFFNESINMTFVPTFRLDFLGEATFEGLIGRSSGSVMPKCRQDYSRLFFTLLSVSNWPQFEATQGNVMKISDMLEKLTTPKNWANMSQQEQAEFVDKKIQSNQYSGTGYVQCRTFDNDNDLRRLSDAKFECFKSDKPCAKQNDSDEETEDDDEDVKAIKLKFKGAKSSYGYGYGYGARVKADESGEDSSRPSSDSEEVYNGLFDDTAIDYDYDDNGNGMIDEFGNEYLEYDEDDKIFNDGCMVDVMNGQVSYDSSIDIDRDELVDLINALESRLRETAEDDRSRADSVISLGGKNRNKTKRKKMRKTKNKTKKIRKIKTIHKKIRKTKKNI